MSATQPASLTVQVPLRIRRRPGRKTVVTPDPASPAAPSPTISTQADPALVRALARAFRYQRMLEEGRYSSITEIAEAERLDRVDMGRLLQLTLLAPEIVQEVLDGTRSKQLELPLLMKSISTILRWRLDTRPSLLSAKCCCGP